MRKFIIFMIIAIALMVSITSANIIHVPGDYPTIQEAVDSAQAGDTVIVGAGTYFENLIITQPISLIGEHRDSVIIDGSGAGDVVVVEESGTRVCGVTITNSGAGTMNAGLEIDSADSCLIESCRFQNNYAGLDLLSSSYNCISRCIFEMNTCGVRFWEINEMGPNNNQNNIENNIFGSNSGIGIIFEHSSGTYHQNCLIKGNRITANGQGIWMMMSRQNEIRQNHIEASLAYGISHQVCVGGGGLNLFHHNNFIQNNGDTLQAMNLGFGDDLWYSTADEEGNHWSDYTGPDNDGDGIGDIPQDICGDDCVDMYPLMSPLTAVIEGVVTDGASQPVENARVDVLGTDIYSMTNALGEYYLPDLKGGNYDLAATHPGLADTTVIAVPCVIGETIAWDIVMGAPAGVEDDEPLPEHILLAHNYPNPFNSSTVIEYSLPVGANVTLEIYDIMGRKVEMLFAGYQIAGNYRQSWDAGDLPSGIYFYKLNAGDLSDIGQMALIK